MGIQDLQQFLESVSLDGGAVSVDLLRIARNVTQPQVRNSKSRPCNGNKLKLVLDGECCLDRLYGGYFSDWVCGGQWNRMVQFLSLLMHAVERGNIDLAVVFNGTLEPERLPEWIAEQNKVRQRVRMILKHINTKGTPPPKVWWTAPTCLRTSLRMALRHLNTSVMCTMDDHHQEVIAFCRESNFHGLMADDAEYAAFDPPRYFSAANLKLTYKGSLETKEFMVGELCKSLRLTQEQVCVLAALLGNYLLTETELYDLHVKIGAVSASNVPLAGEELLRCVADYVRNLPHPPSELDALATHVWGTNDEKRTIAFRQSVQYYLNGTANGYLKYCAPSAAKKDLVSKTCLNQNNNNLLKDLVKEEDPDLDTSGFASETTEQEHETLQSYKLATANAVLVPEILTQSNGHHSKSISNGSDDNNGVGGVVDAATSLLVSSSTNNSPQHADTTGFPPVSADVLRTASLRHQKGLMAPMILHVLNGREVRLPYLMEDETNREFAPIHEIYKPLRQKIYAVLFNLHHLRYVHTKKKESSDASDNNSATLPVVIVREWIYARADHQQRTDLVKAEPLPWAVPTLQRLWFGPSVDDKRRRLRALLSCLCADAPLILNPAYVPQQMLVMACVLRYIMAQPVDKCVLRRQELDAFLCQAFSPDLMNAQYLQELTLNVVTSRGVQLAALFMEGVEMALVANDACGAPLPWLMCCPWLYFDGKLFHHTLARSAHSKNLLELCENHIDRLVKVERMRKAILEGLDVHFAKMPMPPSQQQIPPNAHLRQGIPPPNCLPSVPLLSSANGLHRHRPMASRGGQLQVAGVVVGSWGANYGYNQQMRQQQPQQLVAGGRGRAPPLPFGVSPSGMRIGFPTYNVNKKNVMNNKKKVVQKKPREREMTVRTENGDVNVSDILERSDH